MKICEGEKKAERTLLSELAPGEVFTSSHVDGYLMQTNQGYVVVLTSPGCGTQYTPLSDWDVIAVYPNACINPGEPE